MSRGIRWLVGGICGVMLSGALLWPPGPTLVAPGGCTKVTCPDGVDPRPVLVAPAGCIGVTCPLSLWVDPRGA
jgi:hypothetical protein